MKFTLSAIVVLALAASQATAVVPKPIKECTRSYVVEPGTPGCDAFAKKFGVTFDDLLKWNEKLSPKCDNLDVGEPICVSITKGECCLNENPKGAVVPKPGVPPQAPLWDDTPYTKTPAATGGPVPTSASVSPSPVGPSSPTGGPGPATSVSIPSNPTSTPAAGSSSSAATKPSSTPNVPGDSKSAASSSKASMVLAAAGVVLSVAYML